MADLSEAVRLARAAQPVPPALRALEVELRRVGARARLALFRALQACGAAPLAAFEAARRRRED
jgi:hypothetical protein